MGGGSCFHWMVTFLNHTSQASGRILIFRILGYLSNIYLLYYLQVRYQFGLFDEIHVIDDEEVRHCNWVRFLRSSTNIDEVNMVAVRVKGQTLFQVVTQIPPNGELTVYFDATESAVEAPRDIPSHRERVPTEHLGKGIDNATNLCEIRTLL